MRIAKADVETNGLDGCTKIHLIWISLGKGWYCFRNVTDNPKPFLDWVAKHSPDKWVFHNGLGFDCWVINRLLGREVIKPEDVIDTMVVSKLVNYSKFRTHSLKELGLHLGVYKDDYAGGWEELTQEMEDYGKQDVVVLNAIWEWLKPYVMDSAWSKAMRVEHDVAILCNQMKENGFQFNVPKAGELLTEIKGEMSLLENRFEQTFPPKLKEVNRIKIRYKKDGDMFQTVLNAFDRYPATEIEGEELVCFDYDAFDPASPKKRIDVLWDAGWKPTEKTDGHKKFLRSNRTF